MFAKGNRLLLRKWTITDLAKVQAAQVKVVVSNNQAILHVFNIIKDSEWKRDKVIK